ncbi:hypothetical protein N2152v2_008647 [Parachlorella kessleri]
MDSFDDDLFDTEEQDVEEREPTREQIVFLIDAQQSMLEPSNTPMEALGLSGKESWLQVATKVAAIVLRQKVISSDKDEVAVIFYNTRETRNDEKFDNAYTFLKLEEPSATNIRKLESVSLQSFDQQIGSARKTEAALRSGLWTASSLLLKKDNITRRVLVFTNDDQPVTEKQGMEATQDTIEGMAKKKVAMQLFPMVQGDFDLEPFWKSALALTRFDGEEDFEESEQVGTVADLQEDVRHKTYRKRPLNSLCWQLGEGFKIAVRLYAVIQPARKGGHEQVDAITLEKLIATSAMLDDTSGEILAVGEERKRVQPKTFFPNLKNFKDTRFPMVYISREELQQIKSSAVSKGLSLLGFKPLTALKEYHQLRNPSFIYPDEKSTTGSTVAFAALHKALLEKEAWALCSFMRTNSSDPRLVALLPQREGEDPSGDWQPPGFNMVYLPYADDIREPEQNTTFTGGNARPEVTPEQMEAAEALIEALPMPGFRSGAFANPALQRHYEVLEALALREEPPDVADLEDETLPDFSAELVQPFKDAVFGEGYDENAKAAGKKRKAAGPLDDAELAAEVEALDIEGLAARGQLGKLTIKQLEKYLKLQGLRTSGKDKAERVARIQLHLDSKPGPSH